MSDSRKEYNRRLLNDREHLLYRLDRIGFVPDKDMRMSLEAIRHDLIARIEELRDELAGSHGGVKS